MSRERRRGLLLAIFHRLFCPLLQTKREQNECLVVVLMFMNKCVLLMDYIHRRPCE